MNDQRAYYIPQYLDEPQRIIVWTIDEAVGFIIPFLIFLIGFNSPVIGFLAGGSVLFAFTKLKGQRGPKYVWHLAYWYLPPLLGLRSTPASHLRQLLG